jgi:iron-sulfur cluster insertion protein
MARSFDAMESLAAGEGEITLSARAARRIAMLIASEADSGTMLRVSVSGGGCSGFQYGFGFETEQRTDDITIERDGIVALVDRVSAGYMAGSEIDYVEDLIGASFQVKNPNAVSGCGCGTSFSLV